MMPSDVYSEILENGFDFVLHGVPHIRFHREAPSAEEAIRYAVADVGSATHLRKPPACSIIELSDIL